MSHSYSSDTVNRYEKDQRQQILRDWIAIIDDDNDDNLILHLDRFLLPFKYYHAHFGPREDTRDLELCPINQIFEN